LRKKNGSFHGFCVVLCVVTYRFNPYRERIQRFSLRFNSDLRVVRQHLLRDVTRNRHDCSVARLRFGELRDCVVSKIMETEAGRRTLDLANICATLRPSASRRRVL